MAQKEALQDRRTFRVLKALRVAAAITAGSHAAPQQQLLAGALLPWLIDLVSDYYHIWTYNPRFSSRSI